MTRSRLLVGATVAVALIALGQMFVIRDGVAMAHPRWSPAGHWVVAIGFELAIVVTGLAAMVTHRWALVAGEVVLATLSVATGWWTIMAADGPVPRWVMAGTMAWLPVQYLIACGALAALWSYKERQPARGGAAPAKTATPDRDTGHPAKRPTAARTDRQRVPMPERVEQLTAYEREFPGAPDSELARVMGVEPRTVRRIRQARTASGIM